MEFDIIVIGGGFFGCRLALTLQRKTKGKILLIEKGPDLMLRASYNNQARVHNGYHYPRSLVTALRSRINFPKFVQEYPDCIVNSFDKFYAIAGPNSKVTSQQYKQFFKRIEAPVIRAPEKVRKLFHKNLIQEVLEVKEYAFDSVLLRERVWAQLEAANIKVMTNTTAIKICSNSTKTNHLQVISQHQEDHEQSYSSKFVFNCTYANINKLLIASGLDKIHLKQELTELALIEVPDHIKNMGITVMCGPFFSLMPFPSRTLHTLSHVRYTPHTSWYDRETIINNEDFLQQYPLITQYKHMLNDATRYIPSLKESKYIDSLWEIKTVLPSSEFNDSRPILFKKNESFTNLYSIMGGKIDNIYDMEDLIKDFLINEYD
jgi:glycine/D-amino acid oxidase-like deaminating enzyme